MRSFFARRLLRLAGMFLATGAFLTEWATWPALAFFLVGGALAWAHCLVSPKNQGAG